MICFALHGNIALLCIAVLLHLFFLWLLCFAAFICFELLGIALHLLRTALRGFIWQYCALRCLALHCTARLGNVLHCFALHRFGSAMRCCALLCVALHFFASHLLCAALLYFAMLYFAVLRFAKLGFALPGCALRLLYTALRCFDFLGIAVQLLYLGMLCFAVLCLAVLSFASRGFSFICLASLRPCTELPCLVFFNLRRFTLTCFASRCFDLLRTALTCIALHYFTLQCFLCFMEHSFFRNWGELFDLDTLRVPNRSPTPISKSNDS